MDQITIGTVDTYFTTLYNSSLLKFFKLTVDTYFTVQFFIIKFFQINS